MSESEPEKEQTLLGTRPNEGAGFQANVIKLRKVNKYQTDRE